MTAHTGKTMMRLLVSVACLSALACGEAPRETTPPVPAPATETEAGETTDTSTVRVDAAMLRDLRITTAKVESRPGGEQVALLGELAVDERTYAEVGVPMAARVTRLLVTDGDTVREGQTLAEITSPELGRARAEYLSAAARATLADAALDRKRVLATERIAPLREVQEAESQAAEARASLRSARAALGAFGVQPPIDETDAAARAKQASSGSLATMAFSWGFSRAICAR